MTDKLKPCPLCNDPMQLYNGELIAHVDQGDCLIGAKAWQADERNIALWNRCDNSETSRVSDVEGKWVDLLTRAVADISAALIMAGKRDRVGAWTAPYAAAINRFDAQLAAAIRAMPLPEVALLVDAHSTLTQPADGAGEGKCKDCGGTGDNPTPIKWPGRDCLTCEGTGKTLSHPARDALVVTWLRSEADKSWQAMANDPESDMAHMYGERALYYRQAASMINRGAHSALASTKAPEGQSDE